MKMVTSLALRWAERNGVRSAVMPHGEANAYRFLPHRVQRFPYEAYDVLIGSGVTGKSTVIVTSQAEEEDVRRLVGPKQDVVRLYLGSGMKPLPRRRFSGQRRTLMLANFGVFRDSRRVVEASKLRSRRVDHPLRLCGTLNGPSMFTAAIPKEDLESADCGRVLLPEPLRKFRTTDLGSRLGRPPACCVPGGDRARGPDRRRRGRSGFGADRDRGRLGEDLGTTPGSRSRRRTARARPAHVGDVEEPDRRLPRMGGGRNSDHKATSVSLIRGGIQAVSPALRLA